MPVIEDILFHDEGKVGVFPNTDVKGGRDEVHPQFILNSFLCRNVHRAWRPKLFERVRAFFPCACRSPGDSERLPLPNWGLAPPPGTPVRAEG